MNKKKCVYEKNDIAMKSKEITLTRKIELTVHVPNNIVDDNERNEYKNEIWSLLRNANQQNFELHNFVVKNLMTFDSNVWDLLNNDENFIKIRNNYLIDRNNQENKKYYFSYIKNKEIEYVKSLGYDYISNLTYNKIVNYIKSLPEQFRYLNSYTYCAINKNVVDKYLNDKLDVNLGKKNITFYKKNIPIPINIKAPSRIDSNGNKTKEIGGFWFNKYDDNTYTFRFKSIYCKHNIELKLLFGLDKSNNRIIVDRIYNNDPDYKLCDSSIIITNKKIYLLLVVKYRKNTEIKLDPNKVLGVDLGMKYAAYLATNNSLERKALGDKNFYLLKVKLAIEKNKREIQKNTIFSRSAHGRVRKLQKVNNIKDYESRFRSTFNHKVSSEIIKCAINWGCGQINVEDLSLITREAKDNRVLRNWAYYDLLNKIEYKAKKYGIVFKKVNPAYTSRKCSVCGDIGYRNDRDIFKCINPDCHNYGKEIHADYNAALNIAKSK